MFASAILLAWFAVAAPSAEDAIANLAADSGWYTSDGFVEFNGVAYTIDKRREDGVDMRRYNDGQRVFSTSELVPHTMVGGEGQCRRRLLRDGAPMQIVVPRGPIGVEIGRFRGR